MYIHTERVLIMIMGLDENMHPICWCNYHYLSFIMKNYLRLYMTKCSPNIQRVSERTLGYTTSDATAREGISPTANE